MLFAYGPLLTNYEISRLWNDLVCVEWDVIANLHTHLLTLTNSHTRYGVAKSCSAVIRLSVCAGLRSDCTVATAIHLRWFKQASHWHDMACNLACQWQKNSLNYAWGCVAMRDRWRSACHVVSEILKCSKIYLQSVTTCHDEIVKCTCMTLGVTHFVNSS